MASRRRLSPRKLQWALLIGAMTTMGFAAATNFKPELFPFSGDTLDLVGLISMLVSMFLTFCLGYSLASK